MEIKSDTTVENDLENHDWFSERVELELNHSNFLNDLHKTNSFTTTMGLAFKKALENAGS